MNTRGGCLVAGVLMSAAVVAQTPAPQRPPVFRAGVDLVRVDVSVFDKNRQPVRGLTEADFSLLEDTKPQPILAFSGVDIPDPPPVPVVLGRPVTWMRDVAPDVHTNAADGRTVVMLVDDALIPMDPKIVANAKRIMRGVIERLGPTDRMAILFSEESGAAHDFTGDRSRLMTAVDRMHPGRALYTFGLDSIPEPPSYGCLPPCPPS